MAAERPDDTAPAPKPADPDTERRLREAEDLALAASGLGSGLLARQPLPTESETVAVPKVCPQCGVEYETAARFCPTDGTSLRPKGSDSLIDRVLAGRYHILKRIGEGGMGRVYLGEHVKMNRQCAIKVMNPALVNDHESAARFAREASSAARIIHPNVAAVFDYGESDGLVYLVMEYVDGEPLSRIISREAPLPVARAVDIARQIAEGLGAAHELGIVHRDLKPDNILVMRTRAGREAAKVVDFGIAKAMQDNAGDALTRTGLVIGTPEFMSPEQLLGDPIDARSDLYALGCILHLMLVAAPPFEAPTREQMIKRRLAEEAPHIRAVDESLSESIDRVVERLLARTPDDRYGSAADVVEALREADVRTGEREAATERAHRLTPRSLPTVAFDAAVNASTEQTPVTGKGLSRRESRRTLALVAGAMVVGVGALLASGLLKMPGTPPPEPSPSGRAPATPAASPAAPSRVVTPAAKAAARRDSVTKARAARAATARTSDSASAARLARQRADSTRRAQASIPAGVRDAIQRYTSAIESGDVERIKAAYPGLTDNQRDGWRDLFGTAEHIKVRSTLGRVVVSGNSAELPLTLEMNYDDKTRKMSERRVFPPQRLRLERTGTDWVIRSVR